ncbi:isopeptide-forming domain-containing fimbrial protein [Dorea formicigenerans]|uniref:Isopeptide-forming domain-containing fimbrial protein n=1 Tax=Dorea formicigenerans TaxID=39486 RepID=A0A3E4MC81_9FIRM|nr:SpaH/EbpB family LPXTG-anchored major pilin [Dorea formicigenerans]RGI85301.1 isopeptide-forming domain-containing fimbrial protein [Dorea formicigenerans]RGI88339.1 isopeptide-forming domain-containing fimbrial protein [Dorea formicigenerans]RGK47329.1 isopeptide-forming domain-containing fimbrial protein [Dorea formicigenerans]RHA67487.1 isopeptide-forming domain-containing fimbrial protein [Dorea formicigenerans]
MKRMKRIMALMLAAIMMMAMSVTAFAAEGATGTHTLTVNVKSTEPAQDLKGQTINLYKLFDVTESKSGETTNYAYTVNNTYKDALASVLKIGETSKDEEFVKAVADQEATIQQFANDFTAKALTDNLGATKTSGKITESKTSYEFTGLDAGYYLVYVTGGKEIQSSLVTVDADTNTVNLKTEAPSITKTADKETVSIGQVVKYTVTGSIPDTTGYAEYVYKIHDELSTGLDFVNDAAGTALEEGATTVTVAVAFGEGSTDASTAPTTATLDSTNKKKMSLDLSEWVRANQTNKGKEFTVTYYAKVNKDAVVTEKNNAKLEYGNNPTDTTTTTPSEAKTPTYPLDILKTKKDSNVKLAGAKFSLYTSEADAKNGTNPIKVTGKNGNYVVDSNSTTTEFESVENIEGKGYNLRVNGLAEGTYYLVETKAPDGYNKLTAPVVIKITKSTDTDVNNWTISKDGTVETDKIIDIANSTGSLLPSTGGRGAIAFAVIAALLVFGVAVSFIRDKRKEA